MSLDEAKNIFSPAFLQQLNSISINGNLGDFVTARDGLKIVQYFREQNTKLKIIISTNAGAQPSIWPNLANLDVEVLFCIDGLANTHELYRRQTKWSTVIDHAKSFIQSGGNATWKMVVFDHNRHEIEQCRDLSNQLGFRYFKLIDQGRDAFPVFDQKKNFLYSIGQHTQPVDFTELHQLYVDSTTNGYIEPVETDNIQCQVQTKRSVYITATGEVYPCCWLGFYPRTMSKMGNEQIVQLLPENNNANQVGIAGAIQWFNNVEDSWSTDPMVQCKINCGIKTGSQ
jgi:sulfatase maturation enzyme AslB (radical SAM superfamily)